MRPGAKAAPLARPKDAPVRDIPTFPCRSFSMIFDRDGARLARAQLAVPIRLSSRRFSSLVDLSP